MVDRREFFPAVWRGRPGLMNPQVVRKTMQEPLVAGPAQFFPRRHREAIMTRQRFVIARNQRDSVVVGGKQCPTLKIMFGRQIDEEVNLPAFVLAWPPYVAADISRGCRHKMSTLLDDPNRNAATTQATHHTEAAVVRTHDQRTGGSGVDVSPKIRGRHRLRKSGSN